MRQNTRLLVAASLVAFATLALSACGSATELAAPSAVSDPQAEGAATAAPDALSANLEALYAETSDAFIARSMDERKALCSAEMIKLPLDRVGEAYAAKSGNAYDKVQGEIGINSDAATIVSSVVNLHRLAAIQKTPDLAVKLYSCLYMDPLHSPQFIEGQRDIQVDGAFGYPIEAIANDGKLPGQVPTKIAEPVDAVDDTGESTRSQAIESQATDGKTFVGTYVFVNAEQPFWSTN